MDSENVITLNMNNQEWGGLVHRFNCSINNYRAVNGAYAPMNDAHYFGQRVFNMYQEWIGARPIRQSSQCAFTTLQIMAMRFGMVDK